jgi:5'-nucleotidase (lipoprotein e(P4) family)
MTVRFMFVLVLIVAISACSHRPETVEVETYSFDRDMGLLWVKHAAEYEALSMQAYHQAERALSVFVADKDWTALPGQTDAGNLPPAIIFDVDETVLSGVDFQLSFERPITQTKLDNWYKEHAAQPVAGFTRFASAARAAGIELFFVTNRPCEQIDGVDDPCPYEETVLNAIQQTGIETDADHVMLAYENTGWDKEKLSRRELIARSYRVIMLFGDDLSDFIPCVRAKPAGSCTDTASPAGRDEKVRQYSGNWGNGWYILPNPMHGSWTSQL